jgi:hypothetical protein
LPRLLLLVVLFFMLYSMCMTRSVAAFFQLIGEEWRGLFSEIRTREFKYVKPDKRLLLDVAQVGVQQGLHYTCNVFASSCATPSGILHDVNTEL